MLALQCVLVVLGTTFVIRSIRDGQQVLIDRWPPKTYRYQLDINTASAAEFSVLPNIGDKVARRIIAYRQQAGPFGSHDELSAVDGIGERTVELLKPYLLPIQPIDQFAMQAGE